MAYFTFKFYNEKTVETQKVAGLNNEISSLQSTVNNQQEKIDTIYNTLKTNNTDENSIKLSNTNSKENMIKQFLTSGKAISTDSTVGAGYPEMYYFTSDGKFAYLNSEYGFTKEGEVISSIGTWQIKDNRLIFNVQQAKKVKGGQIIKGFGSIGDHLENYTEEISKSVYTEEYTIEDLIIDPDKTYNTYYLRLDKFELFQLNIGEDINALKTLAINGNY